MTAPPLSAEHLQSLASRAERADVEQEWPEASWKEVMQAGAGRWSIPQAYGGEGASPERQLAGSEAMGSACLTTAFLFSQREAAIRHVLRGPQELQETYLPDLASGKTFITIGLSQLTTSRQHRAPSLVAEERADGRFRLHGEIPWVTGAPRADAVVIGATLDDGRQALFLLPKETPGVEISPPLPLSALAGSVTSSVQCQEVVLPPSLLLAGPKEQLLGGGGGGGLETSCLALGLTRAAVEYLRSEAEKRLEIGPLCEQLETEMAAARAKMLEYVHDPQREEILQLRARCTLLALRSTQAALLYAKGQGFVAPHPAQRWARQALFFLVWSCPRSVTEQVSAGLAQGGGAF